MHAVLKACAGAPIECSLQSGVRQVASSAPPPSQPRPDAGQAKAGSPGAVPARAQPAAAVPGPSKDSEDDKLTLVEQVEEVLYNLAGEGDADMSQLSQEAQRRVSSEAERLSKKWYQSRARSFEVKLRISNMITNSINLILL